MIALIVPTIMVAFSASLEAMIFWRFVQGLLLPPILKTIETAGLPRAGFTILGRGCARGGDKWAAFKRGRRRECDIGHVAGQTFQRKFLPEWEVRIAIPH